MPDLSEIAYCVFAQVELLVIYVATCSLWQWAKCRRVLIRFTLRDITYRLGIWDKIERS